MKNGKNILCIGAGYVGGPTMAVIAEKCQDYKITVVDINPKRISAWNSDTLPVFEPNLSDIIQQCRGKNLFFSTDIENGIKEADIIFISVNTPTKTFGEGAGKASNLQYLESTARSILKYANSDKIVVEKSTLPLRSAETIKNILSSQPTNFKFEIISNPEFLAEGSAINDLRFPDRILIGHENSTTGLIAKETIADIYRHWVTEEKIKFTSLWSSELTKLAANAMLAQRISSVNSLSALCEVSGANIDEVASAIGMDKRIGDKFLKAGIGFGGSCFKKDILNLVYLCEFYGLHEVARYWERVVDINDFQQQHFVKRIREKMFNNLADKKLAIWGFAFKANTNDTRETPALNVTKLLLEERANLSIYDPQALDNAKIDLANENQSQIEYTQDPYHAVKNAHAILILTDWPEFKSYDFARMYELMEKPAYIFDGRNLLNGSELRTLGFQYFAIGK